MDQNTTHQLETSKRRASRTINKETQEKGEHSRWNVESKGCLIWERTCQTGKKREKKRKQVSLVLAVADTSGFQHRQIIMAHVQAFNRAELTGYSILAQQGDD